MNCGAGLKGPWCHVCGQRDDDFRRPFLSLGNEFVGDIFAWDSRIFRSVPPFLLAPGMLTRSFMKGKRGKYVSPLRLYFVLTLVFFAALSATDVAIFKIRIDAEGLERFGKSVVETTPVTGANVQVGPEGEVKVTLERAKDAGVPPPPSEGAPSPSADAPAPPAEGAPPVSAEELEERFEKQFEEQIRSGDFPVHVAFFSRIEEDENFEGLPAEWKKDLAKQIDESQGTEADKQQMRRYAAAVDLALTNPRAFNQIFNTWIPRILIIVVPLFALLTSFLYGRQKRLPRPIYYIDHLVFSIYFHSFIFFLMLLLVLKAEWVGNVWSGSLTAQLFFLVIALYLFVGMKQAFGQGWFKTTLKFVFLYAVYFVTLACALLTLLIVGVLSLPVTT